MARRYQHSAKIAEPVSSLPLASLTRLVGFYLMECEVSRHSDQTLVGRGGHLRRLGWWAKEVGKVDSVGTEEVRRFLHYLATGHKEPGGRWGNVPHGTRPVTPGTINTYYGTLRAFFNWCIKEEELTENPMAKIPRPIDRPDQVQPFTIDQLKALEAAAHKTQNGVRDYALFSVLLDTGIRESELCALTIGDCDLQSRQIWIREGKGGKARTISFGAETKKALSAYLKQRLCTKEDNADEPLFVTEHGTRAGEPLRRYALLRTVYRWGRAAGITRARCCPHTFRHSFAVNFLRNGGAVFSLQVMLGHSSLSMTQKYVVLAQADIAKQHAMYSPMDSLKRGKNAR